MNRPDEPVKYIAFIAIDPLKSNTGALKVIPKSHQFGFMPFRTKKGEAHHTGIPDHLYDSLDIDSAIYVEQDPGDILIFNQLLIHSLDECSPSIGSLARSFRFSFQGFDKMFTPRLAPVSIFGGDPTSISCNRYEPHQKVMKRKHLLRRLLAAMLHKVK